MRMEKILLVSCLEISKTRFVSEILFHRYLYWCVCIVLFFLMAKDN